MDLGMHEWNCPRPGCKKFIAAYTEGGIRALSEEHIDQHIREDHEAQKRAVALEYVGPRKNYNILNVTLTDIGFLKTRGVAIDSGVELDLSIEPKPTTEELPQRKWAAALGRAWLRSST
jgi:hypothetical protein